MIEIIIKNYLEENLENITVEMEQPHNPPTKYILMQLIDSGRINQIEAATIVFTIKANSLYEAAELCESVKNILFDAITLPTISHAGLGGERAGTNAADHVYEYEMTFNFYYYREE